MNRLQRFDAHAKHPINGKLYAKLNNGDRERCREFIRQHDHLDANEFATAVNRFGLGASISKNQTIMWALISQTNPVTRRCRK